MKIPNKLKEIAKEQREIRLSQKPMTSREALEQTERLMEGPHPEITIESLDNTKKLISQNFNFNDFDLVISIRSFGEYSPLIDEIDKEKLFTLTCIDVEEDDMLFDDLYRKHGPSIEKISPLISFIKEKIGNNKEPKIYIHCHAGVSRSPAVAILCLLCLGFSLKNSYSYIKEINKYFDPNKTIVDMGLQILSN